MIYADRSHGCRSNSCAIEQSSGRMFVIHFSNQIRTGLLAGRPSQAKLRNCRLRCRFIATQTTAVYDAMPFAIPRSPRQNSKEGSKRAVTSFKIDSKHRVCQRTAKPSSSADRLGLRFQ